MRGGHPTDSGRVDIVDQLGLGDDSPLPPELAERSTDLNNTATRFSQIGGDEAPGQGSTTQVATNNKSGFYQDQVIVRFKENDNQGGLNAKFLTSRELSKLFIDPRNSVIQLKDVGTLQVSIKSKTGCGVPIFVEYRAPLNEDDPAGLIDYGLENFTNDY